jgi:ABC-type metal ion transport system, periplasmic component/surface adhesin
MRGGGIWLAGLVVVALAGLWGCGRPVESGDTGEGDGAIRVVATVGMVGDIVRNVAGDRADVTVIMGEGVDPHLYTASRDDVAKLVGADMIFYSGLMLEGKMADTLVKLARKKPVVAVTESIDKESLLSPEEMEGHYDPHLWMDPLAWAKCVDAVADALAEHDPAGASTYRGNAAACKARMEALHAYGKQVLGSIPPEKRVLITSHDAFNYFGRAFGLEVQGVQGLSTESETGLQRINQLVDLIVDRGVEAVFVETSVPRKNIEALVNGARARGHELRIGGSLFSDAMGSAGTYEGTYIGMLDHNITTVARALGGEVPAGGFQGKLNEP